MKKLMILMLIPFVSGCWTLSEGEKVGTIVMVANKGFFIKTWHAALIRGRMQDGSGSFGQTTYFNINPEHISAFQKAMTENKEVKVKYHQELFAPFTCNYGGNYIAEGIEFIN